MGITRAKKNLFITRAKTRTLFGRTSYNQPSRFLNEIPDSLVQCYAEKQAVSAYDIPTYTPPETSMKSALLNNSKPEAKVLDFAVGDTVKHRKFGIGTIISAQDMGKDMLLKIKFEEGEKNLLSAYAPIEKI